MCGLVTIIPVSTCVENLKLGGPASILMLKILSLKT